MPSTPVSSTPVSPTASAAVPASPTVATSLSIISTEIDRVVEHFVTGSVDAAAAVEAAAQSLRGARRVFVLGAGRSGLALQMTAMRLMHLGLSVHVVGEVTTPAIAAGDTLLVASGSGTTTGIVRAAKTAVDVGAEVVCFTTDVLSPLAALAAVTVLVPAAQKQDHGGAVSAQYAGGLFEQSVLLLGDAIFHSLWLASGATADELWPRHANLE